MCVFQNVCKFVSKGFLKHHIHQISFVGSFFFSFTKTEEVVHDLTQPAP